MSARSFLRNATNLLFVIILLLAAQVSVGQSQPTLLRLQRSKTAAELDATGGMRSSGGNILSLGGSPSEMGTSSYPNSASCVLVYSDGKYVFEKRDEAKVGRPKTRVAEGTLSADDLQELKSILSSDNVKNINHLKPVELPPNAQLLREAETLDVQISREGDMQHFVAAKERFKMQAIGSSDLAGAPSTGMDTYIDNAAAYRKSLNPLMKWFDGIEKKS